MKINKDKLGDTCLVNWRSICKWRRNIVLPTNFKCNGTIEDILEKRKNAFID